MRRSLLLALAIGGSLLTITPVVHADTYPGGAEGCVATSSGTKSCELKKATRDGGYVSNGQWKLTIKRAGKTIVLTDQTHKTGVCTTAILKGDYVKAEAISGGIAVGNPYPNGTPSTGSGKPGDYAACKK